MKKLVIMLMKKRVLVVRIKNWKKILKRDKNTNRKKKANRNKKKKIIRHL